MSSRRVLGGYIILVAVFLFSFIFTVTPPLLHEAGLTSVEEANYVAYAPFCHQLDSRSFHVWGVKLAVCARCSGVYLGFLIGVLAYPLFRKIDSTKMLPLWILVIAVTPLVLDGATQLVGLRESSNILRLATGLLFGGGISPYLVVVTARILDDEF